MSWQIQDERRKHRVREPGGEIDGPSADAKSLCVGGGLSGVVWCGVVGGGVLCVFGVCCVGLGVCGGVCGVVGVVCDTPWGWCVCWVPGVWGCGVVGGRVS